MWALLTLLPASVVHSTFGRSHGMQLCRRWATALELPADRMYEANTVVRARLALEHPSSFLIAGSHDEGIVGFVCTPVGHDVIRVDAVVWPTGVREHGVRFQMLRKWHAENYGGQSLVAGSLDRWELDAWHEECA